MSCLAALLQDLIELFLHEMKTAHFSSELPIYAASGIFGYAKESGTYSAICFKRHTDGRAKILSSDCRDPKACNEHYITGFGVCNVLQGELAAQEPL